MHARIPQLDAIRGIAVLMVIMKHISEKYPSLHLGPYFGDGWMGVDLFFALSGFLITGILLDTRPSPAYFRNFYARRCLRIWPLYYSLLLFLFAIVPIVRPSEAQTVFAARSSPWWSYPLFLQNFLVPNPTMATGSLGVTWSLAIEEQFYLFWPFLVRYCSSTHLRRIAVAVVCLSPLLRLFLASHGVDIYSNPFCRLDALMGGALLALLVRSDDFVPAKFTTAAWIVFGLAAPLALTAQSFDATWAVLSFTALASSSFLYLAIFSPHRWLQKALHIRFLLYTGTISYGLYLLHKIPIDMAQTFHLDRHPLLALPMLLLAAYALAALSRRLLEKPFLRWKRFFESKPGAADATSGLPEAAAAREELT